MSLLAGRDAAAVLDAVYELATIRYLDALPREVARLAYELVPVDRSGWVIMDVGAGIAQGTHWPGDIPQLLGLMPQDLADVPLVTPLVSSRSTDVLCISDLWSTTQWHNSKIYSELYGPLGVEHQAVAMMSVSGTLDGKVRGRVEGLSLVREDLDFSDRERGIIAEFSRHVRATARRLRAPADIDRAMQVGLTRRQAQALMAIADGATMQIAASRIGVTAKTLGNHLQAAYERLGVGGRLAALARLREGTESRFAVGEIPR
jgi:DNA-binding CsgD family transcriptional regulator